ncbi:MAG TPA: lactate permease LctP family transporter [Bryobacteraceae bacterium]|nr:lactate permease LctP family transporter [Bryobacteraceae bacterium]
MNQPWVQEYDPCGNQILSTVVAAFPVCLLFYMLAIRKVTAYLAAVYSFVVALLLALLVFHMPPLVLAGTMAHGFVFAVIRIAWTLVTAVFVYDLTVETGKFPMIVQSIGSITDDRRLQVLLIPFAFGALLEGAAGGGSPVAICSAMMVGLGFRPFEAATLSLIANTAPVAYGAMGNPIRTLVAVTSLPEADLSAMVGRILPWTALLLPFWLIRAQCTARQTLAVWPGLLACGITFASIQFFWSNYMDATLVDIIGGLGTLVLLAVFFSFWKPCPVWRYSGDPLREQNTGLPAARLFAAWSPFLLMTGAVIFWGLPMVRSGLDAWTGRYPVPGLHLQVLRHPPVVASLQAEPAIFEFAWLSSVGTATFLAGLLSGRLLGLPLRDTLRVFRRTVFRMRFSVIAILAMLGLGFVTRYSGMDAVLGLALTRTGWLYPFFGTLIGWLGVALTGTDAGSNALFGSLQVITARNLNLSPVLMAAANSAGGVMGKMIDAQSIIIACAATGLEGREGDVFRSVLKHSIALAVIVSLLVLAFAYLMPEWIPEGRRFLFG